MKLEAWVAIAAAVTCTMDACAATRAKDVAARAVAERRIAAVMRHDLDAIAALYAPDAIEISPGFCSQRVGREGVLRTYGDLFKMFPDITNDRISYTADGNRVAVQFLALSRKADGTVAFQVPIANFLTVEHGLITRDETYFDTKGRPCS
jgi:ketosteroid isomerase-like protein